ncbi:MAG: hypothetical protein D6770_11160 [Anaerolineae bacterium]|nr:MAG: hypothetical protein D6770_11160 [Anaerolineae bacterium]
MLIPPLLVVVVGVVMALVAAGLSEVGSEAAVPSVVSQGVSPLFTPEVRFWSAYILQWSKETGIEPNLIATVMQIESCGDPFARSRAGAMGLFQVMPYHFSSGENPYEPGTNARRGLAYLQRSLERAGGDVRRALAGYNGGLGVISLPEALWPAETRRYVTWGTAIYEDARRGATESAALLEWLARGGNALCAQARRRQGQVIPPR